MIKVKKYYFCNVPFITFGENILNMKKIILIGITLIIANLGFSQLDDNVNDVKNFRFGLKGNLTVDWLKPDNSKKFKNDGSSLGYGWGAQLEYRLNKTASIVTGIGLQTAKGKINFYDATSKDSTFYILNKDEEFQQFDHLLLDSTGFNNYFLQSRKYRINYVTIPIALKMKTKEIGYFTYYGQFGLNIGFKSKVRVEDEVKENSSEGITTKSDLDLAKGITFGRMGVIFGGGAEYTISGSTALFFDLTYNFYFTNVLDHDDEYLGVKDYKVESGYKRIKQKATPGSVVLTVGILF